MSGDSEVGRVIPNAPSALPTRQRFLPTPPPWTKTGEVFFLTLCCTPGGHNQLAHAEVFAVLPGAFEHYARNGKGWPQLFLAMPDHFHALMSFSSEIQMGKPIRDWKRYTAKKAGLRWQDGFFDHRLRGDDSFVEKANYIRMNPVRAGLVSRPDDWPYVWPACVAPETAR